MDLQTLYAQSVDIANAMEKDPASVSEDRVTQFHDLLDTLIQDHQEQLILDCLQKLEKSEEENAVEFLSSLAQWMSCHSFGKGAPNGASLLFSPVVLVIAPGRSFPFFSREQRDQLAEHLQDLLRQSNLLDSDVTVSIPASFGTLPDFPVSLASSRSLVSSWAENRKDPLFMAYPPLQHASYQSCETPRVLPLLLPVLFTAETAEAPASPLEDLQLSQANEDHFATHLQAVDQLLGPWSSALAAQAESPLESLPPLPFSTATALLFQRFHQTVLQSLLEQIPDAANSLQQWGYAKIDTVATVHIYRAWIRGADTVWTFPLLSAVDHPDDGFLHLLRQAFPNLGEPSVEAPPVGIPREQAILCDFYPLPTVPDLDHLPVQPDLPLPAATSGEYHV